MKTWDYREADALLNRLEGKSDWRGWHALRSLRGYDEGRRDYRSGRNRDQCPKYGGPDGMQNSAAWLMAWDECYRVDSAHADLDRELDERLAKEEYDELREGVPGTLA